MGTGASARAQVDVGGTLSKGAGPALPGEGGSPDEQTSRNVAAPFKLESLGATFAALPAPEPNLREEARLSVCIKGDIDQAAGHESAPLLLLFPDSGGRQATEVEILERFDAQNRIIWKAARHNNIEVADQGKDRYR
jgi:hypothetical protein